MQLSTQAIYIEPILKEAYSRGYPQSAICVQRFDDSLSFAIRITYRISLRSSSLPEPRYPSLEIVWIQVSTGLHYRDHSLSTISLFSIVVK